MSNHYYHGSKNLRPEAFTLDVVKSGQLVFAAVRTLSGSEYVDLTTASDEEAGVEERLFEQYGDDDVPVVRIGRFRLVECDD